MAAGRATQNPLLKAKQLAKHQAERIAQQRLPKPTPGSAVAAAADAPKKAKAGPQLDGEGKPYITLAQLIKKLNLAPTGGAAKHVVRAGGFTVNGEAEARPGRKLHQGDTVVANGKTVTVTLDA